METDNHIEKLLPLVKRQEIQLEKCWNDMVSQKEILGEKLDEGRFKVELNLFKREIIEMLNDYKTSQENRFGKELESCAKQNHVDSILKKYCL